MTFGPTGSLPIGRGLAVFLAVLITQRVIELVVSARHVKRLRALGARECASGHFPLLVLIHVLFPLCLVGEVLALGAQSGPWWPIWLGIWLGAQFLRYAAVSALGERWTVGIWVIPGQPLVRTGPYRLLRHPNYVAVVTELMAAPLMFGAWRTALVITGLNLLALRIRVRAEERALQGVSERPAGIHATASDAVPARDGRH